MERVQKCQDTKYYLLLNGSNDSNWNEIIQKSKIINKLATRQLSLHRKAILLNTEFNVHKKFPLPNYSKTETLARKIIFLHGIHGSFCIKAHNIATRIKHILNLKQQENPLSWTYIVINPNLLLWFDWLDKKPVLENKTLKLKRFAKI